MTAAGTDAALRVHAGAAPPAAETRPNQAAVGDLHDGPTTPPADDRYLYKICFPSLYCLPHLKLNKIYISTILALCVSFPQHTRN